MNLSPKRTLLLLVALVVLITALAMFAGIGEASTQARGVDVDRSLWNW